MLSTVISDNFVCLGCHPSWKCLLSNKITHFLRNLFLVLTNTGHVLLLICCVFVCLVKGKLSCVSWLFVQPVFYDWFWVSFCVYVLLIFCNYLYGCCSAKILSNQSDLSWPAHLCPLMPISSKTRPHPPLDLHIYPHPPTKHITHPRLISMLHPDLPTFANLAHICPNFPKPTYTHPYTCTHTHAHPLDISSIPNRSVWPI